MKEDQHDQGANREEDEALDPSGLQMQKDRRLRWTQTIVSGIDAVARVADIAQRLIR